MGEREEPDDGATVSSSRTVHEGRDLKGTIASLYRGFCVGAVFLAPLARDLPVTGNLKVGALLVGRGSKLSSVF